MNHVQNTLVAQFIATIRVESRNVAFRKQKFLDAGIWLLPVNSTEQNSWSFIEMNTTQIKKKSEL